MNSLAALVCLVLGNALLAARDRPQEAQHWLRQAAAAAATDTHPGLSSHAASAWLALSVGASAADKLACLAAALAALVQAEDAAEDAAWPAGLQHWLPRVRVVCARDEFLVLVPPPSAGWVAHRLGRAQCAAGDYAAALATCRFLLSRCVVYVCVCAVSASHDGGPPSMRAGLRMRTRRACRRWTRRCSGTRRCCCYALPMAPQPRRWRATPQRSSGPGPGPPPWPRGTSPPMATPSTPLLPSKRCGCAAWAVK